MSERFYKRLMLTLRAVPFDKDSSEALSTEIGLAERDGYELSKREDNAWEALTERILDNALEPLYFPADRVRH